MAFRITKELGLIRKGYFILGFTPNETEDTIKERISFIEEIDPDEVGFTIYIPVPGTSASAIRTMLSLSIPHLSRSSTISPTTIFYRDQGRSLGWRLSPEKPVAGSLESRLWQSLTAYPIPIFASELTARIFFIRRSASSTEKVVSEKPIYSASLQPAIISWH